MVFCAVYGCPNSSKRRKDQTYSESNLENSIFFPFPKNKELRKIWEQKYYQKDKINPETAFICNNHFLPDDYSRFINPQNVKMLKPDAFPLINLHPGFTTSRTALFTRNTDKVFKKKVQIVGSELLDKPVQDEIIIDEELEELYVEEKCDKSTDTSDIDFECESNIDVLTEKIQELEERNIELKKKNNDLKNLLRQKITNEIKKQV